MAFPKIFKALLLFFAVSVPLLPAIAQTYSYTVLYSFKGKSDGALPYSGVILDSAGNLYGATTGGGFGGFYGSVYKLSPEGTFTLLHSFGVSSEIVEPISGLVRDSAGNLYGSTASGGKTWGGFFKINEKKQFADLFNFPAPENGGGLGLSGDMLLDSGGNLYSAGGGGAGSCFYGGCGAIYKLQPDGSATILHSFKSGANGCYPNSGLVQDAAGNLYGTTAGCGDSHSDGVIFKIDPSGKYSVLHTFQGIPDGAGPNAELILDAEGNLYGSTIAGGNAGCSSSTPKGCGTIFKLDANGDETVLYRFTGKTDGGSPGSVVRDSKGNLYGPASGGKGFGVIFKLNPSGKETVIYNFIGGTNGADPVTLTMDSKGNFYGTTVAGGNLNGCLTDAGAGCGVVFKLAP
jgi:uncharacterized repeat protein (TIGR03803 family)